MQSPLVTQLISANYPGSYATTQMLNNLSQIKILPRTGVWSVIYTSSALVLAGIEEIMFDDTFVSAVGLDFKALNSEKQNEKFSFTIHSHSIHSKSLLATVVDVLHASSNHCFMLLYVSNFLIMPPKLKLNSR
jgi:hypothetical protein